MTDRMNTIAASARRLMIFQWFKYGIYLLLALNILLFLSEEWLAASHTFSGGVLPADLIGAFNATVDTAAWVVLLLLFEMETFQIPEERVTGSRNWPLHGIRAFCYLFIGYAFYGYAVQCAGLYNVSAIRPHDLCGLAGDNASFMVSVDDFVAITAANCASLPVTPVMYQLHGVDNQIVTDAGSLLATQRLAWTDVINSGDWLLVVLLLEVDVRLKRQGILRGGIRSLIEMLTAILYLVLLGCAVYWGFAGKFLDFWDAFLWLVAFVFIEMNVFEWQDSGAPAA